MELTGACSNQRTRLVALTDANQARASLVARAGRARPRPKVARRPARATDAIVAILAANDGPLALPAIAARVEEMLGRSVNRGSVKAALSEFAASGANPIQRVRRGRYEAKPGTSGHVVPPS